MKDKLPRLTLEIARSEFKDVEFTTVEMFDKLVPRWAFKLTKGKIYHMLKKLADQDLLQVRKEYVEKWEWSSTAYRFLWKV